jgi:hypothetical protein
VRQRERREREGGFGRLFGLARYELMKTPPRWVACARAVIEYLVEWEQGGPAAIVTTRRRSFKSPTDAAPTVTEDRVGRAICMGVVPIRVGIMMDRADDGGGGLDPPGPMGTAAVPAGTAVLAAAVTYSVEDPILADTTARIDTDRPLENGPAPVSSQKASLECRREIFRLWVAHLKPLRQGLE